RSPASAASPASTPTKPSSSPDPTASPSAKPSAPPSKNSRNWSLSPSRPHPPPDAGTLAHPRIGNHDRRRPHGHPATAGQRPVRPVAGPRAGRDPRLRRRPARYDPQRGGGPNRPDPGHGAAVPAHPGGAGIRP